MDKIHVIYGSTTGMTEAVAAKIADALGAQVFNVNADDAAAFDAELLVLVAAGHEQRQHEGGKDI